MLTQEKYVSKKLPHLDNFTSLYDENAYFLKSNEFKQLKVCWMDYMANLFLIYGNDFNQNRKLKDI